MKKRLLVCCMILFLSILACTFTNSLAGLPTSTPETPTSFPTNTPILLIPTTSEPTVNPPTNTPLPPTSTPSATPTITSTSIPCNRALFIDDVNYPDGTVVSAGANFTKKWKIKNTGSCSWDSSYSILFDHGDRMGAPDWVKLTNGSVSPGSTVEISVDLTAPTSAGTYQADFKLRSADGVVFGIGENGTATFYVQIKVNPILLATLHVPPLVLMKPDLTFVGYSITPSIPTHGVAATIAVTIKNEGTGNSGAFTVRWYQSDSAPVDCAWAVPSLAAGATKDLSCNYVFPSPYANINTRATIDDDSQINESDESNNVFYKAIKVN